MSGFIRFQSQYWAEKYRPSLTVLTFPAGDGSYQADGKMKEEEIEFVEENPSGEETPQQVLEASLVAEVTNVAQA